MKRIAYLLSVSFLLASLLFSPAYAVTFKIATLSPEGSSWMKLLRKHTKNIRAQTEGEVTFKIYPGGVMGDDKAVLRKMRVGQLHGAVLTSGGLAPSYNDIGIYNLPMLFRDEAEVDHVRQTMDAVLMAGLREKKFVGFGVAEVGFAYPMSNSAGSSIADMRQKKVWVPDNDPASLRAFQSLNITPVPLPLADVLTGLQTGLIDSIGSPPIGAIVLQWHTQIEYVIDIPVMYVYGLFAIAERPFNRLTESQKAIVSSELSQAVKAADGFARRDHESAKAALINQGINWINPTVAESKEWDSVAGTAIQRIVDAGFVSSEAYNQIESLLAEFRAGSLQ
jgi:TRAP-type C4-dicarboxylate transport system substrate-binding protein